VPFGYKNVSLGALLPIGNRLESFTAYYMTEPAHQSG